MKHILTFLALLLCVSVGSAYALKETPLWVALLRSDSVLVPFAMYNDLRWSNPWPKPTFENLPDTPSPQALSDIPSSWSGQMPLPTAWKLLSLNGDSKMLRVSKPVQFDAHCAGNWGLLTDYHSKDTDHFPPIGVALSSNQKIEGIKLLEESRRPLDDHSTEWEQLLSFVKPIFQQAETKKMLKETRGNPRILNGRLERTGHPLDPKERGKVAIKLNAVYRGMPEDGNTTFYYLEAVKEYLFMGIQYSTGLSILQAWVSKNSQGEFQVLGKTLTITNEGGKEIVTVIPLGFLSLQERTYFIVYEHGYENERYLIYKLNRSSLVKQIETDGGSC
jgi:hypothetical protein